VIIPAAWVTSAIDAHEKLGFDDSGAWSAALDVADEGGDLHALAARKGPVLREVEDWGEGDVGKATRRAIGMLTAGRSTSNMTASVSAPASSRKPTGSRKRS
jgi:phage terminase large subunit